MTAAAVDVRRSLGKVASALEAYYNQRLAIWVGPFPRTVIYAISVTISINLIRLGIFISTIRK